MDAVRHLIVGAGITGLAAAAFGKEPSTLIVEADREIGGYCKTVRKDGFVWDYSGHFFHFKHPDVEAWLRARMPGRVRTVQRASFVDYGGRLIDFPFQKNIHQLPREEFIDCLHDLYFARTEPVSAPETSFKEMLYARFGRGICERFLIPYNEKLYACDLGTLDRDAMGRFFPHAELADVIRNMKAPDSSTTYNATFTYPEGGAVEYVSALARELPAEQISLREPVIAIDLRRRVARTSRREIGYERLISSAPLPALAQMTGIAHDGAAFSWNKVLVYNLGFDRKGRAGVHWVYYPDRARSFYRIGHYDNIFESERMSLYVELGLPSDATVDVEATLPRVLDDLRSAGVVEDHRLLSWHSVVMDPAYAHITRRSQAETARLRRILQANGVYSIGRYGGWTYCSIEDNIVEARALVADLDAV
jgi:protoporphyrinogen oxidase